MATRKKNAKYEAKRAALRAQTTEELFALALRQKPDLDPYWQTICALHTHADRATFEAACALCREVRPKARCLGADVLAKLGEGATSQHPLPQEAATILLEVLHDEAQPKVLDSLILALGHFDDARVLVPLTRFKTHPSSHLRWALTQALAALSKYDEVLAIETLIELSADVKAGVRDWATFALGTQIETDTPAIREALAQRLDDSDDCARNEAIRGLAARHDPRAIEPLLRELESGNPQYIAIDTAIEYAETLGPRLLPALRRLKQADEKSGTQDETLDKEIRRCEATSRNENDAN